LKFPSTVAVMVIGEIRSLPVISSFWVACCPSFVKPNSRSLVLTWRRPRNARNARLLHAPARPHPAHPAAGPRAPRRNTPGLPLPPDLRSDSGRPATALLEMSVHPAAAPRAIAAPLPIVRLSITGRRDGNPTGRHIPGGLISGAVDAIIPIIIIIIIPTGPTCSVRPGIRSAFSSAQLQPPLRLLRSTI
jgi:hypothetical protein